MDNTAFVVLIAVICSSCLLSIVIGIAIAMSKKATRNDDKGKPPKDFYGSPALSPSTRPSPSRLEIPGHPMSGRLISDELSLDKRTLTFGVFSIQHTPVPNDTNPIPNIYINTADATKTLFKGTNTGLTELYKLYLYNVPIYVKFRGGTFRLVIDAPWACNEVKFQWNSSRCSSFTAPGCCELGSNMSTMINGFRLFPLPDTMKSQQFIEGNFGTYLDRQVTLELQNVLHASRFTGERTVHFDISRIKAGDVQYMMSKQFLVNRHHIWAYFRKDINEVYLTFWNWDETEPTPEDRASEYVRLLSEKATSTTENSSVCCLFVPFLRSWGPSEDQTEFSYWRSTIHYVQRKDATGGSQLYVAETNDAPPFTGFARIFAAIVPARYRPEAAGADNGGFQIDIERSLQERKFEDWKAFS